MDNPFADLIPKKAAANPFADLIPKGGVTGAVTEAPLHDMTRPAGPKPITAETIDQSPFKGQGMRSMDPLAAAARDPMLPGGARGLAAVGQEALNVGRQPFDVIQQQLQRLREGGELTPQDAGDVLGASMAGGLKEAPGGARGVPLPEAPKPRVEPPPLATAAPTPSPFESLIPRNAEGRPVVPSGGLPPEAAIKPDPRAAAAGEAAVAKVADRVVNPASADPWQALADAMKSAHENPEGKAAIKADSLKAMLAENYYGVPTKGSPEAYEGKDYWKKSFPDAKPAASKPGLNFKSAGATPPKPPTTTAGVVKPAAPPKPPTTTAGVVKPAALQTPLDAWHAKKVQSWYADMEKEAANRGFKIKKFNEAARVNRAKKQGFDTNLTLYHGAGSKGIWRLQWPKHTSEPAVFVADDPKIANAYGGSGQIMELWGKMENPKTVDWNGKHYNGSKMASEIAKAKAEGHDVLIVKDIIDLGSSKPHNQYAFFKPGNLRSKGSAAFDPKVKEPDAHLLSAAGTPTHELLKQNVADYEDKLPKAPGAVQLVKNAGDTLKAILHPQALNASARRAEADIRKNIGRGVQDSERAKVAMEPYRKLLQSMNTEQQLGVLKWLQKPEEAAQRHVKSGSGTFDPPDELKPFLDAFRTLMLDRKAKLEARTKTGDMGFKEDYVSQMWRDPDAARDVLKSLGPKEGSNSFTKRSVIDDYEAGIKAGLIPVTTDPVEIAMRYVENVDRFIAINDVLEEGAANKDIVWRAPEHAPNGWVRLEGRARSFKGGAFQDAYAPPGYADVYNTFVSKPLQGRWGDILSGAQKISNSVSAFKLAVSGYHALNIAGEANVAGLANAIDKLAGGDVLGAAKGAVGSPAKFVTSVARGRQMLNTYITGMGSPEMQKVVQLAVDANFRVAGKGRVADEYRFSSLGSLWDSWKKGLLKGELAAMGKDIKERPLVGTAKAIVSTAARALETLSDPLFKHYIPMVKNGAYFDMVKTWLDAHPTASAAEQSAFARKAADIIDNRFGEMNQDSIFWHRVQKQISQAMVVSYSYELGTARSVVGAAKDAVGLARGKGWTPNLSYAIALPVMIGIMGSAYQWLKTGKTPDGPRDAMYPQTGGTDPMSGAPARAVLPSYMSQFVNAYYGGLTHELGGKLNGIFDLAHTAWTGTDWRGDPVSAVDDDVTTMLKKWAEHAASTWSPILLSQTEKGGTGISGVERFAGIREAPMFAHDPQAYKRMMDSKRLDADAEKAWHDRNAKLESEGKRPIFFMKKDFIRWYKANHQPKYGGTQ